MWERQGNGASLCLDQRSSQTPPILHIVDFCVVTSLFMRKYCLFPSPVAAECSSYIFFHNFFDSLKSARCAAGPASPSALIVSVFFRIVSPYTHAISS